MADLHIHALRLLKIAEDNSKYFQRFSNAIGRFAKKKKIFPVQSGINKANYQSVSSKL